MQITTVLLIILAAIVSLCFVLFQYFFKNKKGKLNILLGFIRFIVLFCGFLLLINPKFTKNEYYIEKANLVILTDNSTSIDNLRGRLSQVKTINTINSNDKLKERFKIDSYLFGKNISTDSSINTKDKITNIAKALTSLNEVYGNASSNAILLLSDGNQTLGVDYEYLKLNPKNYVFPVVVGDTTSYEDVRIDNSIANKYVFLKNKFPIETSVSYSGNRPINSIFKIYLDGKQVYRQRVDFDKNKTNKTISTLLEAKSVGIKSLKILIDPITNEKNIINNEKEIAIEVIDEKTTVGIISAIAHPDIGVIKKSIETNEQREVQILKPNVSKKNLENVDVFILYQPNTSFDSVYEFIERKGASKFTITGEKTDWGFLNKIESNFTKESYNQAEEVIPVKNKGFSLFDISDLSFQDFPPLENDLGEFTILKPYEVIATQKIKGVELDTPLFFIINDETSREAVLSGENIWKWRVQTYRNERSFKSFDDLMGKVILYLSETKQKNRLNINYETLYDGTSESRISASYFDNSYVFDPNAQLTLRLKKVKSNFSRELPMLLKGNTYEVNLNGLESGDYEFTVVALKEKLSKSGKFKILDFNIEDQFLSADYKKLERFSINTGGKSYFPTQMDSLIKELTTDSRFTPVQKSNRNVVSLIDFRYLLLVMVLALAAEWFIRKYNGLL